MLKYEEYLRVDYTPAEIQEMAKDLARSNQTRASLEQQKKQVDSHLKAQIEEQNTVIGRLSGAIANGCDWRNVECRVELDTPEKGRKRIVRIDTNEEVRVVLMDDNDRQMVMDLQTAAEAAEAAAKPPEREPIVPEPPLLKQLPGPEVMMGGDMRQQIVVDITKKASDIQEALASAVSMGGTHQRKRKGKEAAAGDPE